MRAFLCKFFSRQIQGLGSLSVIAELKIILQISLKAGNSGLNLEEASRVIFLEPHFNPKAEQQAMDRAHRYGQKRPVYVYKLYMKGEFHFFWLE